MLYCGKCGKLVDPTKTVPDRECPIGGDHEWVDADKELECSYCGTKCVAKNKGRVRACTRPMNHVWVDAKPEAPKEAVHHPKHYGGGDNPYEVIKVIDAWQLGFCLGNTVKYIARAGKKDPEAELEDLKKGLWYLQHRLEQLENLKTVTCNGI